MLFKCTSSLLYYTRRVFWFMPLLFKMVHAAAFQNKWLARAADLSTQQRLYLQAGSPIAELIVGRGLQLHRVYGFNLERQGCKTCPLPTFKTSLELVSEQAHHFLVRLLMPQIAGRGDAQAHRLHSISISKCTNSVHFSQVSHKWLSGDFLSEAVG